VVLEVRRHAYRLHLTQALHSYPAVDPGNERVIVDRLSSMQQDVAPFIFCRLKSDWCYILTGRCECSVLCVLLLRPLRHVAQRQRTKMCLPRLSYSLSGCL
jgi:hypothetical protein